VTECLQESHDFLPELKLMEESGRNSAVVLDAVIHLLKVNGHQLQTQPWGLRNGNHLHFQRWFQCHTSASHCSLKDFSPQGTLVHIHHLWGNLNCPLHLCHQDLL